MSISGSLPEVGELSSTADPKVRTLLNELKTEVNSLAEVQHAVKWYEPKVIATLQSTSSASYTKLSTPDEISGIVVPTNGLLRIGYLAIWSATVNEAGFAALKLNGNPFGTSHPGSRFETQSIGTEGRILSTSTSTEASLGNGIIQTTLPTVAFPMTEVFVGAGTFTVSVEFKATSGSVSVKERKLWVEVHGT